MKLTEEQIERMFEKWWDTWWQEKQIERIRLSRKSGEEEFSAEGAFKAAFALLMPVIEKLQESNEFYAHGKNWTTHDHEMLFINISEKDWLKDEHFVGGKLARQTKQQVEELLKAMGGKEDE